MPEWPNSRKKNADKTGILNEMLLLKHTSEKKYFFSTNNEILKIMAHFSNFFIFLYKPELYFEEELHSGLLIFFVTATSQQLT